MNGLHHRKMGPTKYKSALLRDVRYNMFEIAQGFASIGIIRRIDDFTLKCCNVLLVFNIFFFCN